MAVELRRCQKRETLVLNDVVKVHLEAFPGFFLTSLGDRFLNFFYKVYADLPCSGLIVATDDDKSVVGFAAYTRSKKCIAMGFLLSHPLQALRLLSAPQTTALSLIKRTLGALEHPKSKTSAEFLHLSSIAVRPSYANKGVGSMLINELKYLAKSSGIAQIRLETDALDNERVNAFYKSNGFLLERQVKRSEGRIMNIYTYRGNL